MPIETPASPFRTREQKAEERSAKRHALLIAAVRMFNERGFHATLLEDVAASLGVSKPTIYHYLGNKEQVLLECIALGIEEYHRAIEEAKALPGNGLDRLRHFLRGYAQANMADFGRCVIRTGPEPLSAEGARTLRERKRRIDAAMRAFIEEGLADGSIAPTDPKLLAFTLAGALNWPARWHVPGGALSAEELARRMVDMLTAGLAPR
ncbi:MULTISPECIES: TetR/AcrR family transcriptional regulator [unclassified Sphingomonas]|uniref:TetR/AcrR family transcriptional regulator n=1 Tax=unclassified Sphingomonas TaxID=196159 RepID=UPI0006FF34B7|nr:MULTISPECIES: TetR/AcrR family transcriptional regulator [unclassified Sphingomonas]KQX17568.1 TetR family transcriptional regulator [Sphingomonas sp. Root1294]KQY70494.1 TetR family transcriptional regulator [Sphingomonas sp. Root50]KRB92020.1 TetR family transcriptional regulator [Sphingomonas sp. Root720]